MAETQKTRNIHPLIFVLNKLAVPLLAIITALFISGLLIYATGFDPLEAYSALAEGAFGSQTAIIETSIKATPFILVALGIAILK